MKAYYNENDAEKAACLRQFITDGLIAPGEVDERSIKDVQPSDLRGFSQCHFFAGFGVWSYALRLAGWPDKRSVWTGSCPCPSFSSAGKGQGFDDPRHLWPDWSRLICECKPATVFGEQADDAIGYGWLDLVQTDLERAHYAVGKAVLGACSVGAPHIRQRLYFVGHLEHSPRERQSFRDGEPCRELQRQALPEELRLGDAVSLEHARIERCGEARSAEGRSGAGGERVSGGMGHDIGTGLEGHGGHGADRHESRWFGAQPHRPTTEAGYVNGFWRDADWVLRKRWNRDDSEWCPTQPGVLPLAHGAANRVLKIRGFGDAIVPQVAAQFILAAAHPESEGA